MKCAAPSVTILSGCIDRTACDELLHPKILTLTVFIFGFTFSPSNSSHLWLLVISVLKWMELKWN